MMHNGIRWASLALFSLTVAGAGAAMADTKDQPQSKTQKSSGTAMGGTAACPTDDKSKLAAVLTFLHTTHQSELKHAKLATERAQSAEVKAFADRMVRAHTDADKKLTELANKKGISLTPVQPSDPVHAAVMASDQKMDEALSNKKGAAFDAAFMGPEPTQHALLLAVIEEGQKVAKDDEIKRLLDEQHQAVTQHKEHASAIVDKLKPATGTAIGGGPANEGKPNKKGTPNKGKTPPGGKTNPDWITPEPSPPQEHE